MCRSTYAAETLSAEEAFDIGQLCRGFVATVRGYNMVGKCSEKGMDMIDLTVVLSMQKMFLTRRILTRQHTEHKRAWRLQLHGCDRN